ncbi:acyl-CoA N-acyltransferase [Lipomyces kononenkoae]|uniref:Acyl-CoA N-acyltransferase n=1 Tax=Lipomyces kononenkoae TaxID=34357 RepID=A0ACC3STU2_LIPKO
MVAVSPSSISIRSAGHEDVAAVAELGAHVFSTTFGHSVTTEQLQAYLTESYSIPATTKDVTDPMKDMIVATSQDGAIVGFALLTRGTSEPCIAQLESTVELQRIYVHPTYHGNGVGKILIKKLEDMAREQGFKHIWLGVWEENYKAQKVYEKQGYRVVGDHDFTIGDVVQTDQIMVKEL